MIDKSHCKPRKPTYDGPPLETGGTSTRFNGDNMTPSLAKLIESGGFEGVKTILDYGAGRYGRNANALRKLGFRVYAYDPFHGEGVSGWEGVSDMLPRSKFDAGFTSFVLNVVPLRTEKAIIGYVNSKCKKHYHIVRDDLPKVVRAALERKDEHVTPFFLGLFASQAEANRLKKGKIHDVTLLRFCKYGTKTSRGFQRLCVCEDQGLELLDIKKGSWKLYGG